MSDKRSGLTVLGLGFRPFYLLAAVYAVAAIFLWLLALRGAAGLTGVGLAWHTHEMLFGFVPAVMAGFLLTAVRNWTGLPTPTGVPLALLALLWIAARVMAITGPSLLVATVDVLFIPALATVIARPIIRSRNRRNYKLLAILFSLVAANIVYHCATAGMIAPELASQALLFAIHIVLLLLSIIGGRVTPVFTANAIPGAKPRSHKGIDTIAMGGLLATAVATWFAVPPVALSLLYAITAIAHTLRLGLWQPWLTRRNPLLWMLPVSYLWIPLSLVLASLAMLDVLPMVAVVHAMTAGAMTSMMMAMMMRSSLGHTGRILQASRIDIAAYVILQIAAISRVAATVLPSSYTMLVAVSGAAWILSFSLYLVHYGPMLLRPRIDGRPG